MRLCLKNNKTKQKVWCQPLGENTRDRVEHWCVVPSSGIAVLLENQSPAVEAMHGACILGAAMSPVPHAMVPAWQELLSGARATGHLGHFHCCCCVSGTAFFLKGLLTLPKAWESCHHHSAPRIPSAVHQAHCALPTVFSDSSSFWLQLECL